MKLPRFVNIVTGLFAFLLASVIVNTTAASFTLFAQVAPLASPAASAVAAAPAAINPWLGLIPLVVPILVTAVKSFVPKIPKLWLPVIAASIGLALALFDHFTGALGGNPMAVAFLGAAGTGLREIYDQLKQALATPNV